MKNAEKFKEVFGISITHRRVTSDKWLFAEYQGEPTIPLSVIEDIKHEAKMKATTEEVLDEDLYKSSLNEDTSCDCAMDESVVETEVIILDKLFDIIDRKVNEVTHE